VCKIKKSLYGLKQAPRAWYEKMDSFLLSEGFSHCQCDSNIYILRKNDALILLVLYVDDLILTGSSSTLTNHEVYSSSTIWYDRLTRSSLLPWITDHLVYIWDKYLSSQVCLRSLEQISHFGLQIYTHAIFVRGKVFNQVFHSFGWCNIVSTACCWPILLDS
jgi:hypothetical protein